MEPEPGEYRLALKARDGDREALAELVERTRLRLYAIAYAELRHYEDAQDAVAAALIQICRHVTALRDPTRVRAWMQSIVRNEARRLRRGADASLIRLEDVELEAVAPDLSLLRLDIERALHRLPGEQARALRLFYLEGLSIEEIAGSVGRSEGTVKSWLHRGRRHLATQMEEYEPMTVAATSASTRTAAIVHTDLDAQLLRKLREALRAGGYEPKVLKPADPATLPEELKTYQLIVADEWIRGRSALELLMHLKGDTVTWRTPVCLLCSDPSEFTISACWAAGVDRLINKNNPGDAARLKEMFREATTPPDVLPLVAVRDKVYVPGMRFPLFVGRPKTVRAIKAAQVESRYVLIVAQKQISVDDPQPTDLYDVGVAARVAEVLTLEDGTLRVMMEGKARTRVLDFLQTGPFFQVRAEALIEPEASGEEVRQLIESVVTQGAPAVVDAALLVKLRDSDRPGWVADMLTPYQQTLAVADQQQILEMLPPRERLEKLSALLGQSRIQP
jgi:RNA polymerase sigma factor (sigma-70 family)